MEKVSHFLIILSLVELSSAGITPVALGGACTATNECTASDTNSECDTGNTGTCICTANYVEESTVCKVKVDGSTACAATSDCPSHATCSAQCSCDSGYTASQFLCTSIIGLTCASNINCLNVLSNTECKSLQCACVSGYTGSTGTTCTAVVGMACSSNTQCTAALANTMCSSSQCACVDGYTGTSCTDVVIGMACANDGDCQAVLSNTVCTTNQCACDTGFSGSACSSNSAETLSKTTIPIATILLSVTYKYLL